jgi:MYXO-CTERM domain-containing protein
VTYSIVGVDTKTREVGGAGTSCLTGDDVFVIYRGVPGRGVVHAQAYYSLSARDRAAELLGEGDSPVAVLDALTLPSFDDNIAIRQYGVADVLGRTAGYTGTATMPYAGDHQGFAGQFAYSVQGNILTSAKVLEQASVAFEQEGCDLAERLMRALEAGARGRQGDSRCTDKGIPSDSAFLQIERPETAEGDYLSLHVETSGNDDPLPPLRRQLDAWRVQHPCPVKPTSSAVDVHDGGCGCRVASADPSDAGGLLIGGLLIVAWRRKRASRQLRPIQAA